MSHAAASLLGLVLISSAFLEHPQPIDARAVFTPGPGFVRSVHTQCTRMSGPMLGECFAGMMSAYGASPEALTVARALNNQGYLADFQPAGRVSIAVADFVFAANSNRHVLLVNGRPAIIDVDDPKLMPMRQLQQQPLWQSLAARMPALFVFPASREARQIVVTANTQETVYTARYWLAVCHACAPVAAATVAFTYDRGGNFTGTRLTSLAAVAAP